jgi:ubiquinone biosynthesis protein
LDLIPPFARRAVEQIVSEDLGALPEHPFGEFDYTPMAAASIGQVHRAVLKDGSRVAVKVQRPGIDYIFERDCRLLEASVRLIVRLRLRSLYFLRESVRELSSWTRDELDYRREASYCEYLRRNAADIPAEKIPKVYWELTTSRVLTIEFLEGPSVAQYFRFVEAPGARDHGERMAALHANRFVASEFTANIISNFLRDAFLFGAFHADLHPANLLILPGNVVGYVDFGIVAFLTHDTPRRMVRLILAYASGDLRATYECLLDVCTLEEDANLATVRRRLHEAAPDWYEQPAVPGRVRFRVSVTKAFLDLFAICRENGVYLDREMVRFIRSIFYVDGLVSRMAAGSDLAGQLRQAVELWQIQEAKRTVTSSSAVLTLLTDAVLWAQAGPSGLLRSLEALDQRKRGSQSGGPAESAGGRNVRLRAVTAALVWLLMALALVFGWALSVVWGGVAFRYFGYIVRNSMDPVVDPLRAPHDSGVTDH